MQKGLGWEKLRKTCQIVLNERNESRLKIKNEMAGKRHRPRGRRGQEEGSSSSGNLTGDLQKSNIILGTAARLEQLLPVE